MENEKASKPAPVASIPGGADRLLASYEEVKRGRHKKGCECGRCGQSSEKPRTKPGESQGNAGGAVVPSLPPGAALPEVMGSGASLFFMGHALLLDDPAWNISAQVKAELGNILAWMLHDDFYKMGGVGKYVVGGILCLGVYVAKASETAALRKKRLLERKLAQGKSGNPQQAPIPPGAVSKEVKSDESLVSGPLGRILSDTAPKSESV